MVIILLLLITNSIVNYGSFYLKKRRLPKRTVKPTLLEGSADWVVSFNRLSIETFQVGLEDLCVSRIFISLHKLFQELRVVEFQVDALDELSQVFFTQLTVLVAFAKGRENFNCFISRQSTYVRPVFLNLSFCC